MEYQNIYCQYQKGLKWDKRKRNTIGRSNVFIHLLSLLIIFEYNMKCQKGYAHSIFILGNHYLILQMSYSRDSSYGRGRGRSYGGGASKSFNRGSSTTKPVEVGKIYEVDITEISGKGDGIARVQGFIVFIENGKVGNKIRIKVTEVADRFAKATIEV